eukprot:TRINITY_DN16532_c0_g1_i1.p1 TRINITY_DN16532_c0_g1~~TRINITY_DN16532_c0_g1_i1.p1  ORF type:complete len:526 (+),score=86.91 TRINITY_DN16532_c0_g1_i1:55-1632(+)
MRQGLLLGIATFVVAVGHKVHVPAKPLTTEASDSSASPVTSTGLGQTSWMKQAAQHVWAIELSFASRLRGESLEILICLMFSCLGFAIFMAIRERQDRLAIAVATTLQKTKGSEPLPGYPDPEANTPEDSSEHADANMQNRGSSRKLWEGLVKLLKLWLTDKESKWRARGLVALLVLWWAWREASWAFMSSGYHAEVTNKMTTIQQHKDLNLIYHALLVALTYDLLVSMPTFHVLDPIINFYSSIYLRNFLTEKALDSYLRGPGHAYYKIKISESRSGIDNPDQRIADDVGQISTLLVSLFGTVLSSTLGFSMWTAVIFGVGGIRVLQVGIFFSLLRTLIAWLGFGTGIVVARQDVLREGASLRYGLTRIRDSAEEIALGRGNEREHRHVAGLYTSLTGSLWKLTAVEVRYAMTMELIGHFPSLLLWTILLPMVLRGDIGYGDAVRVHMGYDQVSKVFGFLVNNFGILTDLQANVDRLQTLLDACEESNRTEQTSNKMFIDYEEAPPGVALALQGIMVYAEGMPG